jgi:hypothetical protein
MTSTTTTTSALPSTKQLEKEREKILAEIKAAEAIVAAAKSKIAELHGQAATYTAQNHLRANNTIADWIRSTVQSQTRLADELKRLIALEKRPKFRAKLETMLQEPIRIKLAKDAPAADASTTTEAPAPTASSPA